MYAVYYDLETTDKNPIGQILNYSFILVDPDWNLIDELSGLIKISRLQIPDSGAILANRTNVLEHQEQAQEYEGQALKRIEGFLQSCVAKAGGAVTLIGFNSSRFDLNYLRTSFVRNGINPYFNGKLIPRDLLHAVQKAYITCQEFRDLIVQQRTGEQKLSLSLQTVGHALRLLSGTQAHESRADVVLTIEVAKWLKEHCGIDSATLESYEGGRLHSTVRSGAVYLLQEPEYDLTADNYFREIPVTLLDADHRSALWIDLERYAARQDPSCIMWRSAARHSFFVSPHALQDPEAQRTARAAISQFKGTTLKNYFQKSTCDIEQDIYRLDFDALDLYIKAVAANDKAVLSDCTRPEAKILWLRRQLGSPQADIRDPKTAEMLHKYALHRYGGKLQLARNPKDTRDEEGAFHSTLGEMVQRLLLNREAAQLQGKKDDLALLEALERFIRSSDIAKVAGKELLPMWYGA